MNIVFMGTPDYATTIMEGLLKKHNIVALYTQPDKPVGRKQIVTPPHIKQYILEKDLDIPIFQPKNLQAEAIRIKELRPDFIIVAAYGKILPKEILQIAPCINLHASLLPKYRGASPIQHTLLNGDERSGVTAMLMDEGLDTGDILAYDVCKIDLQMDAVKLFEKLSMMAKELCVDVIERFSILKPLKQRDVDATYCKKIRKEDGLVRFDHALNIYNRYRAFIVWPGIFLESGLKLKKIDLYKKDGEYESGKILEINKRSIIVGCKKGALEIIRVQPPSKKEMGVVDYIRGKRFGIGDYLL